MSLEERIRDLIGPPPGDGQVATGRGGRYTPEAPAGGVPTTITVANEATDTTCSPLFVTAATGDLGPKTNANLTFNSSNGVLGAANITSLKVLNSSGATAAANEVGYLDEEGEYKTTTTEGLVAAWCVVLVGGADGSDIWVARRGRVTIELDGNCAAGDWLLTGTTATRATTNGTDPHYAMFAKALTANSGGAGGTCEALLYTGSMTVAVTSDQELVRVSTMSSSQFDASINSGGSGGLTATNVPYDTITAGSNNVPSPVSTTELGKMVLHNLTRGNSRLITANNEGSSFFTTVSSTDDWANNDLITIESQVVQPATAAGVENIDIDLSQQSVIPVTARAIFLSVLDQDTGWTANTSGTFISPFEAFDTSKSKASRSANTNQIAEIHGILVGLISRKLAFSKRSTGAGTGNVFIRVQGYVEATP